MQELPRDLIETLPVGTVSEVQTWWSTLTDAEQQQIAKLWDNRLEVRFFTRQADSSGKLDDWEMCPE